MLVLPDGVVAKVRATAATLDNNAYWVAVNAVLVVFLPPLVYGAAFFSNLGDIFFARANRSSSL